MTDTLARLPPCGSGGARDEALARPQRESPRLDRIGCDLLGSTPAGFRACIKSEIEKLAQVIRNAGIKAQQENVTR